MDRNIFNWRSMGCLRYKMYSIAAIFWTVSLTISTMDRGYGGHRFHYPPDSECQRSVSASSQYSPHRLHSTTPNTQSPTSSMSLGTSPHVPQSPFRRSPAPAPSDNLVRYRAPREPFPQSPLYSHGTHDVASLLHDSSPRSSRSTESGSSRSPRFVPPFCLEPAPEIRDKAPKNICRSHALSITSSASPAEYLAPSTRSEGVHQANLRPSIQVSETGVLQPSKGPRVPTVSSGAASHYNAPSTSSLVYQQKLRKFAIQNSNGHSVSLLTAIAAVNAEHR
ncbi:hypothetical protein DFH29DRAFT_1029139 [Suillus ampliporus]|nr:hypothetical protein DFH29DRAFT_1029139 [Suillus ampliporus]